MRCFDTCDCYYLATRFSIKNEIKLSVQLYQLSRLLRDHEPDLHAKLEALDISPALYAAPWMLTLFTSQFPLGFVVRVFGK